MSDTMQIPESEIQSSPKKSRFYNVFQKDKNYLSILSVTLILVVWFVITSLDLIRFMPTPQSVILALFKIGGELENHIIDSLVRVFAGFTLGCVTGIIMGIAISWNKALGKLFDPLVEFFRPMPPLALIPLFIVWFGIGNSSKILLIAFGCWVNMVVITAEATRNVDPLYVNAARTLGANSRQTMLYIVLPALVPGVVAGVRTAVVVAFGMDVAAEFMGTNSGLGYIIIEGRRFIRMDLIFLGILLITILSMLSNTLVRLVESRLTRWVPRRNE
jgi:taurine transport system permease protein